MTCKNCGYQNKMGDNYCSGCGCELIQGTPPEKKKIWILLGAIVAVLACIICLIGIVNKKNAAVEIKFIENMDGNFVYADVVGYDKDGNIQWIYTTEKYEMTELPALQQMGSTEEVCYIFEGGTITTLDMITGEIRWQNSDFDAHGPSWYLDEENTLYLCGYYGPDLLVIDAQGRTIHQIGSFREGFTWASDIYPEGDSIIVAMDLGPQEYRNESNRFLFRVDPEDFSYELLNTLQESEKPDVGSQHLEQSELCEHDIVSFISQEDNRMHRSCTKCDFRENLSATPLILMDTIQDSNHTRDIVIGTNTTYKGEKIEDSICFWVCGDTGYDNCEYIEFDIGGRYKYLCGYMFASKDCEADADMTVNIYLDGELMGQFIGLSATTAGLFGLDVNYAKTLRMECLANNDAHGYLIVQSSLG